MGNLTHKGIKSPARVTWLQEELCQEAESFSQAVKVSVSVFMSQSQAHTVYPKGSPGFWDVISPATGFLILPYTMISGFTTHP